MTAGQLAPEETAAPEAGYVTLTPSPILAEYIHALWATGGSELLTRVRNVPDGCSVLIFNFSGPLTVQTADRQYCLKGAFFTGVTTSYTDLLCSEDHEQVGIVFKPFHAFPFLNIPLQELSNRAVETDLIDKAHFDPVFRKMQALSSLKDRLTVVHDWLCMQVQQQPLLSGIAHLAGLVKKDPSCTITNLAVRTGYTAQHMNRLFGKYAGAGPKTMQQIFRFQKAMQLLRNRTRDSLTDIGYEVDYYDQAHFINSFKLLSGITPKELRKRMVPGQNRIILL